MAGLIIKPQPVTVSREALQTVTVTAIIKLEPQLDFTLPFTLSAKDVPEGVSSVSFNPSGRGNPTQATVTFDVSGSVANGLYTFTIAAQTASDAYTAPLLISVAPNAFCVINGVVVPVVENGFNETSEPLGTNARSRDGTLVSTVRRYKRVWKLRTEALETPVYRSLAAHLFGFESVYKVMTGEIVDGAAVRVEIAPDAPDVFKANDQRTYYALSATVTEV